MKPPNTALTLTREPRVSVLATEPEPPAKP